MGTWKIIYYKASDGTKPVSDFLDSLQKKEQAKLLRIFHNLETYGLQAIIPNVKKFSGFPLWEIRILGKENVRVIYAIPFQKSVLLLHGFKKKTQKTQRRDLDISMVRFTEWKITYKLDK